MTLWLLFLCLWLWPVNGFIRLSSRNVTCCLISGFTAALSPRASKKRSRRSEVRPRPKARLSYTPSFAAFNIVGEISVARISTLPSGCSGYTRRYSWQIMLIVKASGPEAYLGLLAAHELRQEHALQLLERKLIAKPQGLLGWHRVDNALPQAHII